MKLSNQPVKTGFRVRLMSQLGRYPIPGLVGPSAALITSPELCFTIVRIEKEDWSFSEVECLDATEIPLLGSVLLAGEAGAPYLYPYPTCHSMLIETDQLEEIHDTNIQRCKSFLLDSIRKLRESTPESKVLGFTRLYDGGYDLVENACNVDDQLQVLRRLRLLGPVPLRGVSCLLKARMLFQHPEFAEAGCIFLWIALDAAHSIILEELRRSGIVNPTSNDAARYFERISGLGADWEKFFEYDYENRIRAIHPHNRFGAEAIPQFLADDFLELNDLLIPLYRHLISDVCGIQSAVGSGQ